MSVDGAVLLDLLPESAARNARLVAALTNVEGWSLDDEEPGRMSILLKDCYLMLACLFLMGQAGTSALAVVTWPRRDSSQISGILSLWDVGLGVHALPGDGSGEGEIAHTLV